MRMHQHYRKPWTEAEFWAMAERVGPCLEWQRSRDAQGYGRITWQRKLNRAHRVAWMLARGPIPDGLQVCHTCDNKPCIEPLHLFLGTIRDNARDAQMKGRQAVGMQHPFAKLTVASVQDIRRLASGGVSQRLIAAQFGIAQQTVHKIVSGHSWRHVR